MSNDDIGYIERDELSFRNQYTKAVIYQTRVPTPKAEFAMAIIERWGMVSAIPDGEDSAGRSKLRLQTPDELVERAFRTAELAFGEMRVRGWMLSVPAPREIKKEENKEQVE